MSQEKVNRYKEEKANRKEILAKEKRHKRLIATRPDTSALTINTTALDDYLNGLEES